MKVSIALATYNGASYLQEQLQSFMDQTRLPEELVVTDDCSTDETLEILERFSQMAPFDVFIYKNHKNLGYCGNFNQALLKTSGDLVFLSDQDDVWFPDKIEKLVDLAAGDTHSMVFMNDAALTDSELVDSGLTKLGQIRAAGFSESNFVMGCCAVVKREFLDFCLPIPEGFNAHDNWVVGMSIGMFRRRIHNEVLQYYRRHGRNESQWLVNSLVPVSRCKLRKEMWKARIGDLRRSLSGKQATSESKKDTNEQMYQWGRNSIERCPPQFHHDFQAYLKVMGQRVATNETRLKLRQMRLPQRLTSVMRFWRSGGYAELSGWKSVVRDLLMR